MMTKPLFDRAPPRRVITFAIGAGVWLGALTLTLALALALALSIGRLP